jgi:hypothetical protein
MRFLVLLFFTLIFPLASMAKDKVVPHAGPMSKPPTESKYIGRVPVPAMKPLLNCPEGYVTLCDVNEICDSTGCTKEAICFCGLV